MGVDQLDRAELGEGHDFVRAAKSLKCDRALGPEVGGSRLVKRFSAGWQASSGVQLGLYLSILYVKICNWVA